MRPHLTAFFEDYQVNMKSSQGSVLSSGVVFYLTGTKMEEI